MQKDKMEEFFNNLSEKDIDVIREKYFKKDRIIGGWISIEDRLPTFKALDMFTEGSTYKVKSNKGLETFSIVGDPKMWYYFAKEQGITHWWEE